jgi:hypothetical protein
VGIPYSDLTFIPLLRLNGSEVLEARGTVTFDIKSLSGDIVAHSSIPFLVSVLSGRLPLSGVVVLQQPFLIEPGAYTVFLTIADSMGNANGTLERRFEVPQFLRNTLAASPLTLADLMEDGPPVGIFAVGTLKVRPNLTGKFRRDQDLNLFQQVYDETSGGLLMETLITANGKEFRKTSDEIFKSSQTNVTKKIPLSDFPPGAYGVQTTITDPATGQRVTSTAQFSVE